MLLLLFLVAYRSWALVGCHPESLVALHLARAGAVDLLDVVARGTLARAAGVAFRTGAEGAVATGVVCSALRVTHAVDTETDSCPYLHDSHRRAGTFGEPLSIEFRA